MRIPQELIDEMVAHAREDAPNECCGMVGGQDGEARTVHRTRNALASPFSYDIDSKDLIRTYNGITEAGDELVAIYHSHTRSAAQPSQTDINLAHYPDSVYIIVSLEDPDDPDVRGFWIRDGQVEEARLDVA
ncbi:MAG TPA: M67 family metallopeptidase [Solirubrobacterales bacterium]|nr:M67 family metallopeptidase [Solirubrobacterales bacterium]